MGVSIYDVTVPIFIRALTNLAFCLKKAEEFQKANGHAEADFTTARLTEDMLPFTFQIQSASNNAKNSIGRLLPKLDLPKWEDDEKTFEELHARLEKTVELLKGLKREDFEGIETDAVVIKLPKTEFKFEGLSYVQIWGIPNFFFHVVTAYDILRSKGVPVGKQDYLRGSDETVGK